jgi:GPH family glycoside/pentoside/hexuronide:cation symporter
MAQAARSELREEYIPVKSRVWVSAADGACATLAGIVNGGALTYYFTRWRGLDPGWAGLVWLFFGIWNAVNDPLFGYISDRTKSKLGRRIPYIRYGAPIYALAFIAFWINWPGSHSDQMAMFFQMLFFLLIFDTLYTAIATSIYIMPYEMAISNKARSSVYVWKLIFMVLSTAVPLILIPIIQPGPQDDATSFQWILTALGLGLSVVVFFSTYFYQEKHVFQEEEQPPFLKSMWECFKNRSFLVFEVLSFTVIYVQTNLMQGVLYYFDELKIPGVPMYITLAVGILLGVILWIKQRDKWGVKRCLTIWTMLFAIGCLIMAFLGWSLPFALLGFFLIGVGFSGGMYLIPIMNGDVIDMDEHKTHLRREGMYAGVNSFITKPAISIAQWAFLSILTLFGYNQALGKGMQSTQAQTGILVGWGAIPAVLLFICFAVTFLYPLAGPSWEKIKQSLAVEHEQKEKAFLEAQGIKFVK